VDHVFLAENAEVVPERLAGRLQALADEGFLYLTTLPGPKHPLQNRWYNRCSKPDMAGDHSWVAFLDLDEYLVVLEECALGLAPVCMHDHVCVRVCRYLWNRAGACVLISSW